MILTEQLSKTAEVCPVPHREEGKVNLKLLAGEYEYKGFPVAATAEALRERYRANPEREMIDLYALGVPIVRDVVASAVERRSSRPPYGLVRRLITGENSPLRHFSFGDPYGQLRDAMKDTLMLEVDGYFDPDHLASRFAASPHAQRNHEVFRILSTTLYGGEKAFINNGIDTAANLMPSALRLIPDLYSQQFVTLPEPDVATQIASDNYPFLSRLAVAHLIPFIRLTDKVGGRKKKPITSESCEYQVNEKYTSGLELKFTDETRRDFEEAYGGWLNNPVEGARMRLGCIAAHSDALLSLWNWHVDLGDTIYRQQFQLQTSFPRPAMIRS